MNKKPEIFLEINTFARYAGGDKLCSKAAEKSSGLKRTDPRLLEDQVLRPGDEVVDVKRWKRAVSVAAGASLRATMYVQAGLGGLLWARSLKGSG
jgi:hypothetical protein